ncbi:MAG TPA: hypothetical protein PLZ73_11690 [bacterium]|nr:hypothetical protein [bacterium]
MTSWSELIAYRGFYPGLAAGLSVALLLWLLKVIGAARAARRIHVLERRLAEELEIAGRSNRVLKQRILELKKERDALRENLTVWQRKPRREEIKRLLVYEEALAALKARIPGFIEVWEKTAAEAEEEVRLSNRGLKTLVMRAFGRGRRREKPAAYLEPGDDRRS